MIKEIYTTHTVAKCYWQWEHIKKWWSREKCFSNKTKIEIASLTWCSGWARIFLKTLLTLLTICAKYVLWSSAQFIDGKADKMNLEEERQDNAKCTQYSHSIHVIAMLLLEDPLKNGFGRRDIPPKINEMKYFYLYLILHNFYRLVGW